MFMRIIVNLFIVSSWYVKGLHGLYPCPPNVKIIHICIDDKMDAASNVIHVSTKFAPIQQAIECSCTIKGVLDNYTLTVQGASAHYDHNIFSFAFNGVTIKDNTNFGVFTTKNLTGETVLRYTSPNDDTVQVCLYIAALTDQDFFSMECSATQRVGTSSDPTDTTTLSSISTSQTVSTGVIQTSKKDGSIKTEPITSSTSNSNYDTSNSDYNTETFKSKERSDMSTKPQTSNNTNEDQTILIAAAGGGGGVALIIIIVIVIVCCKRNRKSPPKETASNEATSRADTRPASFCNGSDDDDYGMVLNPSYQPFHEVLPNQPPPNTNTVETNLTTADTSTSAPVYATPLKRQVSQDKANGITTTVPSNDNTKKRATRQSGDADNPASHYDYPRRQAAQVVTSDTEDTYDHTFTSASGKWTGNEYNRVPMRRNEEQNVSDNDTYNVLKL